MWSFLLGKKQAVLQHKESKPCIQYLDTGPQGNAKELQLWAGVRIMCASACLQTQSCSEPKEIRSLGSAVSPDSQQQGSCLHEDDKQHQQEVLGNYTLKILLLAIKVKCIVLCKTTPLPFICGSTFTPWHCDRPVAQQVRRWLPACGQQQWMGQHQIKP